MAIAGISLNRVSIGILNRTSSAYGGLTIGATALTTTRNQALDDSAISTPPAKIVSSPADTASSRKTLLNALSQSLTDLRASLSNVQSKADDASATPTAQYNNAPRFKDEDVTEAQTAYRQQDVFENRDRFEIRTTYEDRDTFEARDTYGTRNITETHNTYGTRDTFETRDKFETRDVYETHDVFKTENITETRNIYETRAVYEQQAVYGTNVDGGKSLAPSSSISAAGIDAGADLAITVGTGQTATIKFNSATQLSVTANGTTTKFHFKANDGSFKTTLATALSSVSGLTASIGSDGKLHLTTANAQSLKIADVANQLFDWSGSPLAALGLTAGTTNASVVGSKSVQTGTEQVVTGTEQIVTGTRQVKTGTEQVKTGTEQVKTGTEQVKTGTEQYVTGTQQVVVGTEQFVTGTEQVKTGTTRVAIGTEHVKVGTDRVKIGTEQVADGVRIVKIGSRRVADGTENVLIGFQTPTGAAALAAALTPQVKVNISTAARKIVDTIGSAAFDVIQGAFQRSTGPDASEDAVALLNALTEVSLTNASSPDKLKTALDTIDGALRATDTLKRAVATPVPSLLQSGLLPLLSLANGAGKVDAASLLIQGISGYGTTSSPSYGSGSATAIGAGVIRINSLV